MKEILSLLIRSFCLTLAVALFTGRDPGVSLFLSCWCFSIFLWYVTNDLEQNSLWPFFAGFALQHKTKEIYVTSDDLKSFCLFQGFCGEKPVWLAKSPLSEYNIPSGVYLLGGLDDNPYGNFIIIRTLSSLNKEGRLTGFRKNGEAYIPFSVPFGKEFFSSTSAS